MRNVVSVTRWSCCTIFFLEAVSYLMLVIAMMVLNNAVKVAASESYYDNHVRSMIYRDNQRDLMIPVYIADFGNPIEVPKGANLMYPPIDDDGYLCTLPSSFNHLPKSDSFTNLTRYSQISIGLLVKDGGNCTAQQKAEVIYEIQQYYPNVDLLLIYNPIQPPDIYDYYHQPTLLLPDDYPVSNIFDNIGILYVKYEDGIKINKEISYQNKSTIYENKSAHFNPDPYDTSTTTWSFHFFISGQPDSYYNNNGNGYPNTGYDSNGSTGNDDENPDSFFWFRLILFGLLIVAPCIRAVYLWHAAGGRIYLRRNELNGRIIGLQYIPPAASWLSIGGPRLQQPATPIRDVISEEEFNMLPEIMYTEPITTTTTKQYNNDEEGPRQITPTASDDSHVVVEIIDNIDNGDVLDDDEQQQITLNTSFNSAAEKGIIGIFDGGNDTNSKNMNGLPIQPDISSVHHIETNDNLAARIISTTAEIIMCTTCSICIEDFVIGETLTFLPRCKHAFHKSCIRPWLLERQGCCPLCKTTVLPDEIAINLNNSIVDEEGEEERPIVEPITNDVGAAATTTPTTERSNR